MMQGVMTGNADKGPDWPAHDRAISTMEVIEEPIQLAQDLAAITCPADPAA